MVPVHVATAATFKNWLPIRRILPRAKIDGIVRVPGFIASRKLLHIPGFAVIATKLAVRHSAFQLPIPTSVVQIKSSFQQDEFLVSSFIQHI